jgi:hypothetical protein
VGRRRHHRIDLFDGRENLASSVIGARRSPHREVAERKRPTLRVRQVDDERFEDRDIRHDIGSNTDNANRCRCGGERPDSTIERAATVREEPRMTR